MTDNLEQIDASDFFGEGMYFQSNRHFQTNRHRNGKLLNESASRNNMKSSVPLVPLRYHFFRHQLNCAVV
ncbi:hypothetical protein Y032_0722g1832 [Ancylostoma ceylanicum]|nr:hypothetical protein Y032_0722g1832 [Ancylostoma ceylanicum]